MKPTKEEKNNTQAYKKIKQTSSKAKQKKTPCKGIYTLLHFYSKIDE